MKNFLIRWLLDSAFDLIMAELKQLASRSDNKLDNKLLAVIRDHKPIIINGIKNKL